jgi:hypothetical protein
MTSPLLTLTQTNFDSSKLIISIVTNSNPVLDFSSSLGSGSTSLSGDSTNSIATGSSISTNGDLVQLVIQINTTFATTNSALTLTGKIVATNSLSASVPPVITRVVATNQNFVLTVSNATMQSLLLSSTDLTTWSPASATISTNGGFIIFILPDAKIEIRRFSIFYVAAVCDRRVVLQFRGSPALADRCHSSFAVS